MMVPMVGTGGVWSLESGGQICIGALDGNLASVAEIIFIFRNFRNFVVSMRFTKDTATINC
jgi:hypothetical protein